MKEYTIEDIMALEPCYDPLQYIPEDWKGTTIDILKVEACPAADRLWVALHFIDDKTARLFSSWCVRQLWHLPDDARNKHELSWYWDTARTEAWLSAGDDIAREAQVKHLIEMLEEDE